jgi:hypothetical protein
MWSILTGVYVLAAVGCCASDKSAPCKHEPAKVQTENRQPALASNIIFDRHPGPYRAGDFAYRSDWPAAGSMYTPGQVIYYREHFVDYQGRGFDHADYSYRRFDMYRVGVGYR